MLEPAASEPAPDDRERTVLRLLAAAHGYFEGVLSDQEALARCIALGWVIPEGICGHALTVDGRVALRGDQPGA